MISILTTAVVALLQYPYAHEAIAGFLIVIGLLALKAEVANIKATFHVHRVHTTDWNESMSIGHFEQ